MKTIAFDWSRVRGVEIRESKRGGSVTFADTDEMLDVLTEPTRIICECSVHSYNPMARTAFFRRCREEGHTLLMFNPRLTASRRKERNRGKSDKLDALTIWEIGTDGRAQLSPPVEPDPAAVAKATVLRTARVLYRGATPDKDRDRHVKLLDELLDTPEEVADLKGTVAVAQAALRCNSRREWESVVGLHGNGYPNVYRSDVYFHGLRNRRKKGVTATDFRRGLRAVYHRTKALQAQYESGHDMPEPFNVLYRFIRIAEKEAGME